MAYRETDRALAVVIRRKYNCSDCDYTWNATHADMNEPIPDCPACHVKATWQVPVPAIGTNKGRAIDIAQQIAEEDFGMTNMRDNQRAGDIAAMGPPAETTAERETIMREMVQMAEAAQAAVPEEIKGAAAGFWQAGGGASTMSVAAQASEQSRREGTDVVGLLEQGREKGISTNVRYDVMARAKMPETPAA